MSECLHYVNPTGKKEFYSRGMGTCDGGRNIPRMQFRIAQYRKKRDLTQREVAEALGISVGLYNQLESGKRRMNETYIDGLAKFYGVSPVSLIVDPVRDDPLFQELDELYRSLSPAERRILVSSAKGIAADRG